MSSVPETEALLHAAREALKTQVIPEATGAARYQALMAANALAIVLRQLDGGPGEANAGDATLAARIRRGEQGPGTPGAGQLHEALVAAARTAVAVSNPKYLDKLDAES